MGSKKDNYSNLKSGEDLDVFVYSKKITSSIINSLETIAKEHKKFHFEFRSGPLKHKTKPEIHVILDELTKLNTKKTTYLVNKYGNQIKGKKLPKTNISLKEYKKQATFDNPEYLNKLILEKRIPFSVWKETPKGFVKVVKSKSANDFDIKALKSFAKTVKKIFAELK